MKIWHIGSVKNSTPHPNLSHLSREQRLSLYGLAVGAAIAAGASPAQANLITLDLTGQPAGSRTTPVNGSLYFDVNAASAAAAFSTSLMPGDDFRIFNLFGASSSHSARIFGTNNPNNVIAGFFSSSKFFAGYFVASHFVGPADNFGQPAYIRSYAGGGAFGLGSTGYLGLKFTIGSDIHYGWANITVGAGDVVTLNWLGYESIPNLPAHTEAPSAVPDQGSTLALMAMGAAGLLAFRRRQQKATC